MKMCRKSIVLGCLLMISAVFCVSAEASEENVRVARSPKFHKLGLLGLFGGGGHNQVPSYHSGYGGGFGGAAAQAQAQAGAGGHGGGAQAQAQSQSLSFGLGPFGFGGSLSQSQSQAQSRRGYDYYDY